MNQGTTDTRLLTIAEIAQRFHLPESTARFYCKRFMHFLPHVGEGKRRRYRPEVIEVFSAILDEMKSSKSAAAVEETLAQRFPRNIEVEHRIAVSNQQQQDRMTTSSVAPLEANQLAMLFQGQQQALERIAQSLATLTELSTTKRQDAAPDPAIRRNVEDMESRLRESQEEVAQLRGELERLKALQAEAELVHQQDLEQLRKFLNHLAREQSRIKDGSQG